MQTDSANDLQKVKTCKACGKKIGFIFNEKTRRSMPCDIEPVKVVVPTNGKTGVGRVVTGYLPHWANCTDPQRFRRSR